MDRRSTFKDPDIVKKVQESFIPVAGDCKEWQFGKTQDAVWFMRLVRRTHDAALRHQLRPHNDEGNTAQGLYIAGADGKSYGWFNAHYVQGILQFLDQGLAKFGDCPPKHIKLDGFTQAPYMAPAASTSIIRVFTRVRPIPEGIDDLNYGVGRDHFWILADEKKEIASDAHDDGKPFSLPETLVRRLVRFHMLDNVRGEPDSWEPREVEQSEFQAIYARRDGKSKLYRFHGNYSARTSDNRRGIEGSIDGHFEIDDANRVLHFRAFSQPTMWGESRFTPGAPPGRFTLAIALIEADDRLAKTITPQFMAEWSDYLQPQ